ncbi:phosphatase PAP2 family protein [Yinghuangia sp. ASG 101]|uniref:phosphatase PAP2 family protein n=1 Tax=Yinghuangia sp. ASG 101 TaxID=2896848 RepID=UPI001E5F4968|nr:phosphatase PAP2 family protein [Yinghuangia sp. ASG 101]UGQ13471.1 phosphatase PAP2 family protein [Yinghuangia sp. ASG 101]
MTPGAFSGSSVDGGLYLRVTESARHTPGTVNHLIEAWTAYGLIVFAALMLAAWWTARGRDAAHMAMAVCAPAVVGLVYLLDTALKSVFAESRPCRTLSGSFTLESCPGAGDWSFPSNHAVIAAAAATMIWLVHRALGIVAAVAAVAMAASRVWVGVHYPHDVAAGLLLGFLMAWPLAQAAARAAPWVDRLRASRWRACVAR